MKQNSDSKYAENWLPVKEIANNAIVLDNGMLLTGVKITPKNIFILDIDSQDNVIYNLRDFYGTIDYEFWLMVTDKPVDLNLYMNNLQVQLNSVQNINIRKMLREDINKAELFMNKEFGAVDKEYFILFKEKKPDIIAKRIRNLISGLAACGLDSRQTTNDDLRDLLDGFFNSNIRTEFKAVISNE